MCVSRSVLKPPVIITHQILIQGVIITLTIHHVHFVTNTISSSGSIEWNNSIIFRSSGHKPNLRSCHHFVPVCETLAGELSPALAGALPHIRSVNCWLLGGPPNLLFLSSTSHTLLYYLRYTPSAYVRPSSKMHSVVHLIVGLTHVLLTLTVALTH